MSIDKFGRTLRSAKLQQIIQKESFPRTQSGDFDVENHRLCNVAEAVDEQDVVTKKVLDSLVANHETTKQDLLDLTVQSIDREEFDVFEDDIRNQLDAAVKDIDYIKTKLVPSLATKDFVDISIANARLNKWNVATPASSSSPTPVNQGIANAQLNQWSITTPTTP